MALSIHYLPNIETAAVKGLWDGTRFIGLRDIDISLSIFVHEKNGIHIYTGYIKRNT